MAILHLKIKSIVQHKFIINIGVSKPKVHIHTSGKNPIIFATEDGASRGTMLYGISSPLKAASDLFIFFI
jgi:hypothetical protein